MAETQPNRNVAAIRIANRRGVAARAALAEGWGAIRDESHTQRFETESRVALKRATLATKVPAATDDCVKCEEILAGELVLRSSLQVSLEIV